MTRFFQDTARTRWGALVVVAALAAALRLVCVLEVHDHPYYLTPLIDAADYHARAMQVMRGEGLGYQVYYKAPAYPFLVGHLYRVVGPRLEVVYILQMLGGVLTAVLVAALGMRWFGRGVGTLAGLLTGLYTPLVYFENQLLIESSALALSVLAVALLVWSRGSAADVGAGVAAGIALQLRPINATLVAALVLWLLLQRTDWTVRLRRVVLLLVPVLLLLVPTLRHNRIATGRLVPISVNGGINFYIGNNPDYDETVALRPGLRWEELTKRFGNTDDPYEWQRGFYRAAFDYMTSQPLDSAALLFKKLVLFWNARGIDRNQDSSVLRGASVALRRLGVSWLVLAPLGLVGLGLTWRRARAHPVHILVGLQMLGVVAFFVTTRYRLAVVPWLAVAAAAATTEIGRAVWRGHGRRLGLLAAAVAGALVAVVPDHYGIGARPFGRPDFDRAQVLARRGDRTGALAAYERAVATHPGDPDVVFRYGEHLERLGRRADAIAAYRGAAELAPASYKPPLSLGAAYLLDGDLERAWEALTEAERRGDPHGRTLFNMGLVRERQGQIEAALGLYRRSLEQPDTPAETVLRRLGVGRCLILLGRPEAAEVEFRAAADRARDPALIPLERAEAWLQARQPSRSLALLQTVPGLDGNARGQFIRARALRSLGRREEARQAARRAVHLDPDTATYRDYLQRLEGP
ncbi:MAG: tetratricopeptide repeat protein [Candidatus Krumholzibacteriia bacterium]